MLTFFLASMVRVMSLFQFFHQFFRCRCWFFECFCCVFECACFVWLIAAPPWEELWPCCDLCDPSDLLCVTAPSWETRWPGCERSKQGPSSTSLWDVQATRLLLQEGQLSAARSTQCSKVNSVQQGQLSAARLTQCSKANKQQQGQLSAARSTNSS